MVIWVIRMDAIKNIVILCVSIGFLGVSLFLVVNAVLRWLACREDLRAKRLNILTGFAVAGLLVMFLGSRWSTIAGVFSPAAGGNGPADTTEVFIEIAKFAAKLLSLVIVVISIALLSLIVTLFLGHGLKAVMEAAVQKNGPLKDRLKELGNNLSEAMKSPIFAASMTWGLLVFFIILPFFLGKSDGSAVENWKDGIYQIVGSGKAAFYQALMQYILLIIVVLGVTFAAFKLLYSVIFRTFREKRERELIDKYSIEIGGLTVGVAMLWMVQDENLNLLAKAPSFKLVLELFKAFVVVILVVALIVLVLEVIRMLLDMREKLIRKEARLLLISSVGKVTLLLNSVLNTLYNAVNSVIGNTNDHSLDRIQEKIKENMVEAMDEELSKMKEHERTFTVFDEVVTKAEEEEGV